MSMFVGIEDEQGIILYPRQLVRGKKKLLFVAFGHHADYWFFRTSRAKLCNKSGLIFLNPL